MPTSLSNQARISYSYEGAISPEVASSNTTVTTLLDEYSLRAEKSVLSNTFRPGENITYLIRLENDGRGELYNISITDNLGGANVPDPLVYLLSSARLYFNGVLVPITPTIGAGQLSFLLPHPLVAGDVALIIYIATVREDLPTIFSQITNTATVTANSGSMSGPIITAPPVCAVIVREAYASVNVVKQADRPTVAAGEPLVYTFTLTNSGNQAATDVVLTDKLPTNFVINTVAATTGYNTVVYSPSEYNLDPSTNTITLPNMSGPQIVVPAAVGAMPGIVTVTIAGLITAAI